MVVDGNAKDATFDWIALNQSEFRKIFTNAESQNYEHKELQDIQKTFKVPIVFYELNWWGTVKLQNYQKLKD